MNPQLGKVPPQVIELEEAVLGALMLEKDALFDVVHLLKSELFYKDSHQVIFTAIMDLFSESEPVDMLTVTNKLRSMGKLETAGGAFYITELTSKVASAANIQVHTKIITEMWLKREMIRIGSLLQTKGYDDQEDCFELMDYGQMQLLNLMNTGVTQSMVVLKDSMVDVFKEVAVNMEKRLKNETTGITTPISKLNQFTGGWQRGHLIIVAARPAMGKTGFALSAARAAAHAGEGVLFFSLEMIHQQLTYRLIAQESKTVSTTEMQSGNITQSELTAMIHQTNRLTKYNINIDDNVSQGLIGLRAKAMRMKHAGNLKMIVVDYLQLLSDEKKGSNREQEISRISRGLKIMAKEMDVPVIALSQLSRAVETRGGDHKPKLSDLRESGSLEQDADMVIFLYRPEYYGITGYIMDDEEVSTRGLALGLIAKHRNGPCGEFAMRFNSKHIDFTDYHKSFDYHDDFQTDGIKNFS